MFQKKVFRSFAELKTLITELWKNYKRPTSEYFVYQIKIEEEMNDIEESLSDQES